MIEFLLDWYKKQESIDDSTLEYFIKELSIKYFKNSEYLKCKEIKLLMDNENKFDPDFFQKLKDQLKFQKYLNIIQDKKLFLDDKDIGCYVNSDGTVFKVANRHLEYTNELYDEQGNEYNARKCTKPSKYELSMYLKNKILENKEISFSKFDIPNIDSSSEDFVKKFNDINDYFISLSEYEQCLSMDYIIDTKVDDDLSGLFEMLLLKNKHIVAKLGTGNFLFIGDYRDVGCYVRHKDKIFIVNKRDEDYDVYDDKGNLYKSELCEPSSKKEFREHKLKMLDV